MLPVALNTRSQFPLHKQKDIPHLSRRLLLSGEATETENFYMYIIFRKAFRYLSVCNDYFSFFFSLQNSVFA